MISVALLPVAGAAGLRRPAGAARSDSCCAGAKDAAPADEARSWHASRRGLAVVILLHGRDLERRRRRTQPIGRFHHLPETGMVVRQPAADTWIYSDYQQPVTSVDLLTHLIYGHGVPQGAVVAAVTVFDPTAAIRHLLRAGVETAEASYPRPEYREAIRHGIDVTEVVRAKPAGLYSSRNWETLTYRAVDRSSASRWSCARSACVTSTPSVAWSSPISS